MAAAICAWSSKEPSRAWARSGILARMFLRVIFASTCGSRSPSIIAARMARSDTVVSDAATEDSLIEVLEHHLQPHRLPGLVAHQLHPVAGQHPQVPHRGRGDEGGTKQPCSSSSAIHCESRTSVLRPGTAFMCAALSSHTSIESSSM